MKAGTNLSGTDSWFVKNEKKQNERTTRERLSSCYNRQPSYLVLGILEGEFLEQESFFLFRFDINDVQEKGC